MKEMNQFLVIGLGNFGLALCKNLYNRGCDVLAIDQDQDLVNTASEFCTHAICADASDESVLKQVNVADFDACIVCIGNIEASVIVTLLCKQLNASYVMTKANNSLHKTLLQKVGADAVIFPEEYVGEKVADMLTNPNILHIAKLTPNFSIIEIKTPELWVKKSLMELELRKRQNVTVLLIKRGDDVIITPDGSTVFEANDDIVLCGEEKYIEKLKKYATIELRHDL
ncbi:MAG TPA: TrkA family potassium uptake protein [Clostridia bacterium]